MPDLQPIQEVTMLGSLFTTQGFILLGMAVVSILLISLFVPGGPKRIIAIVVVIATAGIGAYFLSRRNNKMIDNYNGLLEQYKTVQAESEATDERVKILMDNNNKLRKQAEAHQSDIDEHLDKFQVAKIASAKLATKQASLESEIEIKTQNMESGYKPGTASALRAQWEAIKRQKSTTPFQAVIQSVSTNSISDPNPVDNTVRLSIDIEVNGFRLKGDVA